jgi:hypothetical protein
MSTSFGHVFGLAGKAVSFENQLVRENWLSWLTAVSGGPTNTLAIRSFVANGNPTRRSPARWPQVTLREMFLAVTFFAVLYGLDVLRGDRESLLNNVVKTPILLAVFVLWRTVRHARGVEHVFVRVVVDAIMGAACGAIGGAVLCIVLSIADVSTSLFLLLVPLSAIVGAIGGNLVGFVLGRYRRTRTTEQDQ